MSFLFDQDLPGIQIGQDRWIGDGAPCFIVAEIGQNHNGDMDVAKQLIDNVAFHKADAVKFCKRHIPSELTKEAYDRPYIGPQSFGDTYGQHREFLELSKEQYAQLKSYAEDRGLIFFATACDTQSVDDLEEIGVPLYKVASRDLTNIPLIDYMAQTRKPVVLSCGMDSIQPIQEAIHTIKKYHDQIVLLQCTSSYPTDYSDVNIRVMHTLRDHFGINVGMSDHTIGYMVAVVSSALGACVVEKHVTLARHMKGTDHACSLEPDGLRRLIRDIRNMAKAIGNGEKVISDRIAATRQKLCRSLVLKHPLKKGEVLREEMLCLKSPGTGLMWSERDQILNKPAAQDLAVDITLQKEYFDLSRVLPISV